eukprot:GFKZ01014465.1.p1 GENE.GFKZ01014465.1~~GFKZ01014465.1.p1  ORF type:complete len:275 (-),score=51.60 GFKZ01014465.1:189-1013(-)
MYSVLARGTSHCARSRLLYKAQLNPLNRQFSKKRKDDDTHSSPTEAKSGSNDGENDDEEDDAFGLSGFDLGDIDDVDDDPSLQDAPETDEGLTPELAAEMVQRMVRSATRSLMDQSPRKGEILTAITPHTISVLRASRICTNSVHAALSDVYVLPVTKKVNTVLHVSELKLSNPAAEALKQLAGPRVHGEEIRFSANKFPSREENQALIVSQLDRLVREAKYAVGEEVDLKKLESWDEIKEEVTRQAGEDIIEAGGLSLLIGEPKDAVQASVES